MSNKLLYGKNLEAYDDEDIDELLAKLTEEEIQELNDDLDPDNSLLPPSQRVRNQTDKEPTGPFDRNKLIKFLIDKAKNEKDWDEAVPYEKTTRGKVFVPKESANTQISSQELSEMGFDVEFDQDVDETLNSASEEQLVDLAAVLGFTGMLNQVQFHAGLANEQQECGGFSGVAKATKMKAFEMDPPNTTDIEESIKQVETNDAKLEELNLNNIKTISAEQFGRLCSALAKNSVLHTLQLSNTRLTDVIAKPLLDALKENKTLTVLNLTTNFLSSNFLIQLVETINTETSAIKSLTVSNQRQSVLGIRAEQRLTELIRENKRLKKLGIDLETKTARHEMNKLLIKNAIKA